MVSATCAKLYQTHCYTTLKFINIMKKSILYKVRIARGNIQKLPRDIKRVCEALTWKHQEPRLSVVKYHSKEIKVQT